MPLLSDAVAPIGADAAGRSAASTRCLDVCKGPVVVVCPDSGDEIVLAMVRSPKQRRDLRRTIVNGGALSGRLARRTVTGSKRRTALRRLHRSVRRHH